MTYWRKDRDAAAAQRMDDLPPRLGYNETCANIAAAMFGWRMLLVKGDARYADVLEQVLCNSMLSAMSLDGKRFCYCNPLERRRGVPFGPVPVEPGLATKRRPSPNSPLSSPPPDSPWESQGRLLNRRLDNFLASPNAGQLRFLIVAPTRGKRFMKLETVREVFATKPDTNERTQP